MLISSRCDGMCHNTSFFSSGLFLSFPLIFCFSWFLHRFSPNIISYSVQVDEDLGRGDMKLAPAVAPRLRSLEFIDIIMSGNSGDFTARHGRGPDTVVRHR